jgi:hypothetical protein
MTKVADLLNRDFSRPIEETVRLTDNDPDTVLTELSAYITTEHAKAEYESLFSMMAQAPKSLTGGVGIWISGLSGSGKSFFAKILGYVLANSEVHGTSASSIFLNQAESNRITEAVGLLHRTVPYEIFMCEAPMGRPIENHPEPIAEAFYDALLRDLDYAEDYDIAALEMELEREGALAAFQDLCLTHYVEEWRTIRGGSQKLARTSALLHHFDSRTYAAPDTWLKMVTARPARRPGVKDLAEKSFDLCGIRRHGRAFAFILDDVDRYATQGGEGLENLCAVVEQFSEESLKRLKAGKIPGPAWIVVTSRESPEQISNRLPAGCFDARKLQDDFPHKIGLSPSGVREVAIRRVLRKKETQESILRKLYQDYGAFLMENVKLERCSRRTDFDEDEFVQFYPYLPHLLDLSIDITAGIHDTATPKHPGSGNRALIKQSLGVLVSDRTRLADQPVGVLVSIDKIYELVEANLTLEKRNHILEIQQRFDNDEDYPGMAGRIAKTICLMEFVKTGLPRTTKNIAALLVQHVTQAPPTQPVATILHLLREAHFVREAKDGWRLYGLEELRQAAASLEWLKHAVGTVNPRLPGRHNEVVQLFKKLFARLLIWYTRPLHEFHDSVSRSVEELAWAADHLSTNMVSHEEFSTKMADVEQLSMNMKALEERLALAERTAASLDEDLSLLHQQVQASVSLQKTGQPVALVSSPQPPAGNGLTKDRTTYIIGLFGTGRQYINDLLLQHLGDRAKHFRDTIRLHPGPTPMIYSGHATKKYVSRAQQLPAVMGSILDAVRAEFANLIFIYRHPLDSLLTNWIWWRTFLRDNRAISGISQVYRNTDDLCADLEQYFFEFKAFAEGDPDFFAAAPGPRFLSFGEFVEETELHLQSDCALALRLEDFMTDPSREFSKVLGVMLGDRDWRHLSVDPPRSRPFGYLAVREKVPLFNNFIHGLNAETKRRIRKIGYEVGGLD